MAIDAAQFRIDYPEFADTTLYPDSGVNYWLTTAALLLPAARWLTVLDLGTELFTAHNLVLERKAQAEAVNGIPPGVTTGPVSSKSVDKVSVSYDTGSAVVLDAGHWNNTVYGTRFIQLARMFGAGPVQVGVTPGCEPPFNGPPWFGPPWY